MTDLKLIEDKSKLAILYFKSQEYEKALSTYNVLINKLKNLPKSTVRQVRKDNNLRESPVVGPTIHPKLGSLLDQRAATYEKLGQVASALKDSRELTKLEPIGCKGYLRTGRLLQGMDKTVEAYKCYQEGVYIIEKAIKEYLISVPEKLFTSLKMQYRALNSELKQKRRAEEDRSQVVKKPKRSTDPFVFLPIDLIEIVFRDIPMTEVLKLHLVSKLWYYTLTSIPRLYYFRCKANVALNEFISGARLFKKISGYSNSKLIQQVKINHVATKAHFLKVLEVLIREPGMLVKNLDLIDKHFNLQLFYHLLAKFGWRLLNFKNLESLRIGINCSIVYGRALLNMFRNLKVLEIVILHSEKSSLELVPIQDKIFKKFKDLEVQDYLLEKLLLVNHTKLLIDNPNFVSAQTYNPYPILLDKNFPALKELTLVSFDFATTLPEFGEFLTRTPKLTKLYLENNLNINMLIFLQMIINYKPMFKLQDFTFRESSAVSAISLTEFRLGDLQQFKNIHNLDLYKNCLSVTGLLKLLRICGKSVRSLNIGHSHYVNFALHSTRLISLYDILLKCPLLNTMYLNDMDIDQPAMIQINKDLERISSNFQMLDLSFNKIDGISLLRMFDTKLIVNPIDVLVLNGMEISSDTVQYLVRKGYVRNVVFDKSRIKWQVFGVNSWVQ
ncbi:Protein DIA2 [Candida viswanathii]|uniref:Protein DIA2 n=1 Tax=Candida viswanathii TaxID=5486 RepID=A0A367YPE0_9ASCO|nr:Protein DIA2 [Candida viswanathii]